MTAGGAAAGRPRAEWLDALKGAAILFVVFGHIWRGLLNAGVLTDGPLFQTVDRLIYNFHMPLFFLIAGALLPEALAKRRFPDLLRDRALRLLWPLALWTWAMAAVKIAAGGLANNPVGLADFPFFPLPPFEQFWFLWALFLIQVALGFFSFAFAGRHAPWAWGAAMLAALALYFFEPGVAAWPNWLFAAYRHAPFLVAGALIGLIGLNPASRPLALAALAVFVAAEALALRFAPTPLVALALPMAAAAGLFFAASALPPSWSKTLPMRVFLLLGRASMAIYVAHVIFQAAARIGLQAAGVSALGPHLALGMAAGVLGPLALYIIVNRLDFNRVFGF